MPGVTPRRDVKTNREIWGTDFPVGGEWDAGVVLARPGLAGGRWTVRREPDHFVVVFHHYSNGQEDLVATFLPSEEREAKAFALTALNNH